MAPIDAPARRQIPATRHVVVVADGDVPTRASLDAAWPGWADDVVAVIAADGGLGRVRTAGLEPSAVVGDLDSVDPADLAAAEAAGIPVLRAPLDKDESDTELALLEAARWGATRVTVLGAFGGPRLDHALANLGLLAHPVLRSVEVTLLDAGSRVSLVIGPAPGGAPAERALPGPAGATLSLLPFGGDVRGVTTHGLRYRLDDEPLELGRVRGLSNVRTLAEARVTVRAGRLLVVETTTRANELSSGP